MSLSVWPSLFTQAALPLTFRPSTIAAAADGESQVPSLFTSHAVSCFEQYVFRNILRRRNVEEVLNDRETFKDSKLPALMIKRFVWGSNVPYASQ